MATQRHRPMNTSPPPEEETYRTLDEDIAELTADDSHVTDAIDDALDSAGDFVKEIYDVANEKRRLHTSDDIRNHPAVLAMTPEGRAAFLSLPKRERERMLKKAEKQVLSQSKQLGTPDIGIRIRAKVARANNQLVTTPKAGAKTTVNAAAQATTAAVRATKTVVQTTTQTAGTTVKAAGTGAGLAAAPATAGITVAASAVANVLDGTLKAGQIAQNLAHTQAVKDEVRPRYSGMTAGVLTAILPAQETRKENLPIGSSFIRLLQMLALLLLVGLACIIIPISFVSGLVLEHTDHLMNSPERFTSVYGRACISTMDNGDHIESVLDQLYNQKLTGLANAGVSDYGSLEDYQQQRAEILCLYAAYVSSCSYTYDPDTRSFNTSGDPDIADIFKATDAHIILLQEVYRVMYPYPDNMDYSGEQTAQQFLRNKKKGINYQQFLEGLELPEEAETT